MTPADWTFYINAPIYFWQSLWLTYGVLMVCRKTENDYFYIEFPVIPPILYVVFSFSLACNISWLLIWDREYMEVALVFINLMTFTLYICLVVSLRRLHRYGPEMVRQNLHRDIWLIRIIVCDGLAMFATWGTVAAIFNFAVVLTYGTGANKQVGSTVSLAVFALEIIGWWIFDILVFEKLIRYLYTPYIVLIVSIIGMIYKNWSPEKPNAIIEVVLLMVTIIAFIIKIILSLYRHKHKPLYTNSKVTYAKRPPMSSFEIRHLLNHEPPQGS